MALGAVTEKIHIPILGKTPEERAYENLRRLVNYEMRNVAEHKKWQSYYGGLAQRAKAGRDRHQMAAMGAQKEDETAAVHFKYMASTYDADIARYVALANSERRAIFDAERRLAKWKHHTGRLEESFKRARDPLPNLGRAEKAKMSEMLQSYFATHDVDYGHMKDEDLNQLAEELDKHFPIPVPDAGEVAAKYALEEDMFCGHTDEFLAWSKDFEQQKKEKDSAGVIVNGPEKNKS